MCHFGSEVALIGALLSFLSLLGEDSLVLAVNSPQMTFFTPPSHETMIHLESKYGYSATLKLKRPTPYFPKTSPFPYTWNVTSEHNSEKKLTEFVVLGPDYPFHGVSAVIQEMNLRKNPDNNECIDFIQFAVNGSVSTRSQKICGRISREDYSSNSSNPQLQRSFFNPEGTVHLYFYSDQTHENEPPEIPGDGSEIENIGIEIVFTSYTVCPNPANSWKKLQACSTTDQMSCIYSTLFCDSKVDCGFPGEYGVDEQGCYIPYVYMILSITFGVLLTSTLIYSFVRWVTKVPKEYR